MQSFSTSIIKHKKSVMILFFTTAILCLFLILGVSVNYNMLDYLPEDVQSTKALAIMESEFTEAVPNARVMLNDVTVQEALEYKRKLKNIDGITEVLWLDDRIDLKTPLEMADQDTVEAYYKNNKALISITIREGEEVFVTKEIYELIGEDNALSGNAVDRATAQELTGTETRTAILILIPVIILILVMSTTSWLEPILFLSAIGISVVINMGTNMIFGEVSFITNAVGPILQLAVSLDYAIFLLHSFDFYRKQTEDVEEAMGLAMKKAFPAIAASAATTLFGFMALTFMRFQIGSELGINLVKGIILSFLSVMIFLPTLTLSSYKLIDKTKHKKLLPEFKHVGGIVSKVKLPVLILVALLIVPSYLAQRNNDFTYGASNLSPNSRSGQDTKAIEEEFGKSTIIVLLVPKGDSVKEELLSEHLKTINHVNEVISYGTMVGIVIPEQYLDRSITSQFYSENYCRIIVNTDTAEEGEVAFKVVQEVQEVTRIYYGDTFYSCGQSVNLYDMKNTIVMDNTKVNLLAIIAILLVLIVTFKSIMLPILLLITIETAIWVNLSVPYFSGNALCYIGFLVINTVQLGATVDYAILLTNHYITNRKNLPKKAAIKKTLEETFSSILISATILALAGITLWITSSNPIVSELGILLGRGTIFSMAMVVCFLPAVLTLFDKLIQKTTYRTEFFKERL